MAPQREVAVSWVLRLSVRDRPAVTPDKVGFSRRFASACRCARMAYAIGPISGCHITLPSAGPARSAQVEIS